MITIVTITFNNFDELQKTLNSIPEFDFVESLVINGGSCEKTFEFLKDFHGKSISEKDNGIADAFNKGIKNSAGSAIMFLNSGDILIDENYLKKADEILHRDDIDFVHSNLILNDMIGGELLMKPSLKNLGRGLSYLHPTMIVKKKVFEKIGGFDLNKKIAMDFDFVARMEKAEFKGFYINDNPVVKMDGSGTSVVNEFAAIKECFESLKEHNLLTLKNFIGFAQRILFYSGRIFLVKIGAKNLLGKLKRMKRK